MRFTRKYTGGKRRYRSRRPRVSRKTNTTKSKTCLYKYKCSKHKSKKQRCVYTYICPPP